MDCVRRSVPNDNSCLFYAVAYLVDGPDAVSDATQKELRRVCAEAATADPDPEARAVLLGAPVDEYAEWIQKPHNWGGEHEIIALANHFPAAHLRRVGGRDFVLRGQRSHDLHPVHGDALRPARGAARRRRDAAVPRRRGRGVRGRGAGHRRAAPREGRPARRVRREDLPHPVLRLRREKLVDSDAFQAHCGEVEHGDDFAYECEDIFEARLLDEDDEEASCVILLFFVFPPLGRPMTSSDTNAVLNPEREEPLPQVDGDTARRRFVGCCTPAPRPLLS